MTRMTPILAVNEIFGPTLQGEGPTAGQRTMFLRLAGCNLRCEFCDIAESWDWTKFKSMDEIHPMTAPEIMSKLTSVQRCPQRLVITGGEPVLQAKNLKSLLGQLSFNMWTIELETNGTIWPEEADMFFSYFARVNVSPKLLSSGNELRKSRRLGVLKQYMLLHSAIFKFVVSSNNDIEEVQNIVDQVYIPSNRVWLMPEATTPEQLQERIRWVVDTAIERGWNATSRLQIAAYGNERKR